MNGWTIHQLSEALRRDLLLCRTQSELINAKAIGGREIRETAERIAKTRRLTPSEVMTASEYGYRGQA